MERREGREEKERGGVGRGVERKGGGRRINTKSICRIYVCTYVHTWVSHGVMLPWAVAKV